uniref:Uncharacterized protein n=1 Tax=Arundo donax TaxID=35708 RepID=A0A0A9GBD8_ARUDO
MGLANHRAFVRLELSYLSANDDKSDA